MRKWLTRLKNKLIKLLGGHTKGEYLQLMYHPQSVLRFEARQQEIIKLRRQVVVEQKPWSDPWDIEMQFNRAKQSIASGFTADLLNRQLIEFERDDRFMPEALTITATLCVLKPID